MMLVFVNEHFAWGAVQVIGKNVAKRREQPSKANFYHITVVHNDIP